MSDMKMTHLLTELLLRSRKVGSKENPPLTAERFVVAIIDTMRSGDWPENKGESIVLRSIMRRAFADLDAARVALLQYIEEGKNSLLDDVYMRKKIMEATKITQEREKTELSAPVLLSCIREDISGGLKGLMKPPPKDEEPQSQENPPAPPGFAELMEAAKKAKAGEEEKTFTISDEFAQLPQELPNPKADMAKLVADVKRIRTELQGAVFGQDNAINVFVTGYFQGEMLRLMDKSRKRPRATFLFAGPPGVGKTFLAERAAQALGLPFARFDMSEYADKEANLEFCGTDKVYKNGKVGNVTSFVAKNPRCVLLFDEIEKAHTTVIHLFLQMLDAGRLRDNYTDEEVSFADALIILTTNAGRKLYENSESGDLSTVSRKVVMKALQNDVKPGTDVPFFPAAICSRFASGNVVMFNHIVAHNLRHIAKKEILRHAHNMEKETGIHFEVDERVYTALLFAEGGAADARTVRSRAETFFNDELYELLRLVGSEAVRADITDLETITVDVDLSQADAEIRNLFEAAQKPRVLVFAEEAEVQLCSKKVPFLDVVGTQNFPDALDILKNQDIAFVLVDMKSGATDTKREALNIADVDSPARDLYKFLCTQRKDLPLYLLETAKTAISEEERVSFERQGVRGVLRLGRNKDGFTEKIRAISLNLHQQDSMDRLARGNKLISFESAQTISKNGKTAHIRLFDFKQEVAVDSEDSKRVLSAASRPNVRFADVIGAEDAKQELAYFVSYLKNPKQYAGTGVKAPRGVLLYGPPGTGKTMLAKAMACEAGVTFLAAEGNQFLKTYVGEGPQAVHELFRTARKYAPAILFVDEIDAIAKERQGVGNMSEGSQNTLTAFLTEMDGFKGDPSRPVFVLAATNFDVEPGRPKSLDPALMRRFDRRVFIDLPNKEERARFLKMKIASNPALDISDAQVETIAMRSTGMSLAQLDSAVELALRSAIRQGSTKVTDAVFEEAFETFNGGEVKTWDVSQLERVARHEAGHALLCWLSGDTPAYLTIVARGDHGGYMQHPDREGKAIYTRDELLGRIRTSLGGRAAEMVCYGQEEGLSTGASGDLASATHTARQLVCRYGMDEEFGLAVAAGEENSGLSLQIRAVINRILNQQMEQSLALIRENRELLDALVEALLEKNHLTGVQIEQVLNQTRERLTT